MAEIIQRKSIHDNLSKYDYLAKKDSFIEITEWSNAEGVDVTIDDKHISMTYGELDAINYLVRTLEYKQ